MPIPSTAARAKQRFFLFLVALLLCTSLVACDLTIDSDGITSTNNGTQVTQSEGAQGVQVFVEPDAGVEAVTDAMNNAKKSILLEVYLLTDKNVIQALKDAAHRGVNTRVMLEDHPFGGGNISPQKTMDDLNAAGVKAQPANNKYALNHIKTMVIDDQAAYILTANLSASALGDTKSKKNREYGIIDTNAKDVQDVKTILEADWNQITPQYNNPNLVVSPDNSRTMLTNLIDSAQESLDIEAEIMHDEPIAQHLANAQKRGVVVRIILPKEQDTSDEEDATNKEELSILDKAGVAVHKSMKLYMHAKLIVADGQKAYVGSINFSKASMERNRELGLIISDANVLHTFQQTFQEDWGNSEAI